ncbi:MAG: transposase [Opitutaceae bacterium]|nr:transposase [Opitutaceae bacterium]
MARKLRLEFPGAIYHVINRGNYRAWVFKTEGAQAAFEKCLFEACERSGWLLHAFVIMGNHYHLAVETPKGNLVAGMQWLQSTFANRFNTLRGERGHLFQGRYKSLLVEAGDALGQLCHYLHLNPVRAGIVPVGRLGEFRLSSYWYLTRPKERPAFMRVETALAAAGQLPDRAAGWQSYASYLAWQAAEGPAGKNAAYVSLTRGWALGGEKFKEALLQDYAVATEVRAWESDGVREVRAAHWRKALNAALAGVPVSARTDERKSAPWKVAVAAHLKATTDVPNGWLAEQLEMGSAFYVSKHVGNLRKKADGKTAKWARLGPPTGGVNPGRGRGASPCLRRGA